HQSLVKNNSSKEQINETENRIFESILREAKKVSKSNNTTLNDANVNYCVGDLLKLINNLISESFKYIGPTISVKYMKMTRPRDFWIEKVYFDQLGIALHQDFNSTLMTLGQAIISRRWIENYIRCCSTILPNFEYLLKDSMQFIKTLELSIEQVKQKGLE
ncbi:MAG: hypothetical protein WCD18_02015, partial [Thermosynechococcaceae cyanobacterium]